MKSDLDRKLKRNGPSCWWIRRSRIFLESMGEFLGKTARTPGKDDQEATSPRFWLENRPNKAGVVGTAGAWSLEVRGRVIGGACAGHIYTASTHPSSSIFFRATKRFPLYPPPLAPTPPMCSSSTLLRPPRMYRTPSVSLRHWT